MIRISGLVFEYPGHRALHGVSLSVEAGAITALVGPNGAGKTTLLRCMAALETPYAGQVTIDGLDTREAPRAIGPALPSRLLLVALLFLLILLILLSLLIRLLFFLLFLVLLVVIFLLFLLLLFFQFLFDQIFVVFGIGIIRINSQSFFISFYGLFQLAGLRQRIALIVSTVITLF